MKSAELTQWHYTLFSMKNPSKYSVRNFLLNGAVPDRKDEWDDIYYIAWMDIFMGAIKGL